MSLLNLEVDLPENVDKTYCSTEFMFSETFVKGTFKDILVIDDLKTKCAKKQTAFNHTL